MFRTLLVSQGRGWLNEVASRNILSMVSTLLVSHGSGWLKSRAFENRRLMSRTRLVFQSEMCPYCNWARAGSCSHNRTAMRSVSSSNGTTATPAPDHARPVRRRGLNRRAGETELRHFILLYRFLEGLTNISECVFEALFKGL